MKGRAMTELIEGNPWVWVVIMDPGKNEQFVGQQDQRTGVAYLPVFLEKEEAEKGLEGLAREEGRLYEVQAIRYRDLAENAGANGFMVFLLSGEGRILEKIEP